MILSIVDTSRIQPYIFGTNRLRENIGASYLVAAATDDWAENTARSVSRGTAKLLYSGGGNYVTRFPDWNHALAFEKELSRDALCKAPGLQLVIAHIEYDPMEQGTLVAATKCAFQKLERLKRDKPISLPTLGFSVTRTCRSTGLPAVDFRREPGSNLYLEASAETLAKEDAKAAADQRLKTFFAVGDLEFPSQFEHLGRSFGDQSYIAVVHADGNGMGAQIKRITEDPSSQENEKYAERIQSFSNAVKEAGQLALRKAIHDLIVSIKPPGIYYTERLNIELAKDGFYLPFRPLVYGGDDITFVCDGRLGLALATRFLAYFEEATEQCKDRIGAGLTACAGISIVKSHYPFARAYTLAEDLCRSAKEYRKELNRSLSEEVGSCLDWHVAVSGLLNDLSTLRTREYTVSLDKTDTRWRLHQRPVTLRDNPHDHNRTWQAVEGPTRHFQTEQWAERRNKWKELREALRAGSDAVAKFRELYQMADDLLKTNGWHGSQCLLFDALELADFYIPLPL